MPTEEFWMLRSRVRFCSMAYDAALALLYGEEADHNLTIEPQLITENK